MTVLIITYTRMISNIYDAYMVRRPYCVSKYVFNYHCSNLHKWLLCCERNLKQLRTLCWVLSLHTKWLCTTFSSKILIKHELSTSVIRFFTYYFSTKYKTCYSPLQDTISHDANMFEHGYPSLSKKWESR